MELKVGMTNTCEMTVEKKDTAAAVASGLAEVFATPMMIALMEKASYTLAEQGMEEGCSTVGTAISVNHIAATPVGMKVKAVATLKEIDGRKLTFDVEAFDETEKIGDAVHTRFIIKSEKFLAKAYAKGNK